MDSRFQFGFTIIGGDRFLENDSGQINLQIVLSQNVYCFCRFQCSLFLGLRGKRKKCSCGIQSKGCQSES